MALWPNTEMNTVSAAGGLNLPGRSHATAFLSVGEHDQQQPAAAVHHQHRAGLAGARPPDLRRHGAR